MSGLKHRIKTIFKSK